MQDSPLNLAQHGESNLSLVDPFQPLKLPCRCHACSRKNPLSILATSLGVLFKSDVGDDNTYFFDSKGKVLNPDGSDYKPLLTQFNAFTSWMNNQLKNKDTRSIGDMYALYVATKALNTTSQNMLLKAINTGIEQEYASSMGKLSANLYDEDLDFGSSPDAMFPGGLSGLVQKIISTSSINILYNQVVSSIDYLSSAGQVAVRTKAGSLYSARWVICTLPLGVMQANLVSFNPLLPSSMTTALYQLNMGALERIVLVFQNNWWDPANTLQPGWLHPPIGPPGGLWQEWYTLSGTLGRPVLIGWNAGDVAVNALKSNDATLLASSLSVLASMFPNIVIPQPKEYHVSRWQSNPYSLGSYSSIRPNVTAANINDKLAAPVGSATSGQVLFAGEHTSSQYFGTMHGAILTGQREANRIISAAGSAT